MQQLDAITLKALAVALQSRLHNAKVSKVQHPSAREFIITFWGGPPRPDGRNLFYINLSPDAPFCVLTDSKHRQRVVQNDFEKPTALCMLFRKHLNGANLTDIRTLPGERVVDLVFENFNELGNKVRLVLSLELMGKHSNMIFYDDVQGTILAVAHGVSETMSSYRELAAGLPYAAPPRPAGKKLLSELTIAEFVTRLSQKAPEESIPPFLNRQIAGLGPRIIEDALASSQGNELATEISPEAYPKLYHCLTALEAADNLRPGLSANGERFSLLCPETENKISQWTAVEGVNAMVEAYCLAHLRKRRMQRRILQLGGILQQQLKKVHRREKELSPVASEEIETLQATGDRILAAYSSGEVPRRGPSGEERVALSDYETGEPWVIEIDPSVDWVENAQIYYRRAKKAKARREAYNQLSEKLAEERDFLESLKQLVEQADTLAELDALEGDMAEAGFGPKAGKRSDKRKGGDSAGKFSGVVTLRSSDGLEILLGKSAHGNEAIVGKLSRSDDLWLHVHQMPGSHVLVRTGKEVIPDQTLLEAATLAAHYSTARDSLNIPVIYTQSKFIRKIPHSYPGHVNYRQEKTLFITPDPLLLERLLPS
jgi:predicted ribosome quality control (RQC) complex YloA/Tae2 family protein